MRDRRLFPRENTRDIEELRLILFFLRVSDDDVVSILSADLSPSCSSLLFSRNWFNGVKLLSCFLEILGVLVGTKRNIVRIYSTGVFVIGLDSLCLHILFSKLLYFNIHF